MSSLFGQVAVMFNVLPNHFYFAFDENGDGHFFIYSPTWENGRWVGANQLEEFAKVSVNLSMPDGWDCQRVLIREPNRSEMAQLLEKMTCVMGMAPDYNYLVVSSWGSVTLFKEQPIRRESKKGVVTWESVNGDCDFSNQLYVGVFLPMPQGEGDLSFSREEVEIMKSFYTKETKKWQTQV